MNDLLNKYKVQQELNLPFVLYKKANSTSLIGQFQRNDHLYFIEDFSEKGFIMAPFDNEDGIVYFPTDQSEIYTSKKLKTEAFISNIPTGNSNISAQKDFELLVKKSIEAIQKGYFLKVVVSRKEKITLHNFDAFQYVLKLIELYPTAFIYCWYHPKVGLWIGATPEKLISVQDKKFHTVSLAGTREINNASSEWGKKEVDEQKIVTDYIIDNLKHNLREFEISSPYTIKIGQISHIKTDIQGTLINESQLKNIIKILHPTPAVCGLPKIIAKEFIQENETYDREFYTGYLGELNFDNEKQISGSSDLFVNLRCMQIKGNTGYLYVGCGITKNSIPENEWIESVNKSLILKSIIYS